MKRTTLKRTGGLKRKTPMRRRAAAPRRSERKRDPEYMAWVRTLPCAAKDLSKCYGDVEADHAGKRGMRQKADDRTCIPLCLRHHQQRGDFHGPFRRWNTGMMRTWLDLKIVTTGAQWAYREETLHQTLLHDQREIEDA